MSYRKARIVSIVTAFAGAAIAIISFLIFRDLSPVFVLLGFAVIIAGGIINIAFGRCPNCRRFVRVRSFSIPDYCPFCGEPLDPEYRDY